MSACRWNGSCHCLVAVFLCIRAQWRWQLRSLIKDIYAQAYLLPRTAGSPREGIARAAAQAWLSIQMGVGEERSPFANFGIGRLPAPPPLSLPASSVSCHKTLELFQFSADTDRHCTSHAGGRRCRPGTGESGPCRQRGASTREASHCHAHKHTRNITAPRQCTHAGAEGNRYHYLVLSLLCWVVTSSSNRKRCALARDRIPRRRIHS